MRCNLQKCGFVWSIAAFLVLGSVLAPLPVQAQTFTASLQGTVTDPTGSVVPGARVSVINEATNVKQEKVTDSRGGYLITLLPPGTYRMTVELTGFQTSIRTGMVLQVQQQAEVNVVL